VCRPGSRLHRFQECPLGGKVRQEELADVKASPGEPAAADEKRVAAGAAGKARGLEIDEQEALAAGLARKQSKS